MCDVETPLPVFYWQNEGFWRFRVQVAGFKVQSASPKAEHLDANVEPVNPKVELLDAGLEPRKSKVNQANPKVEVPNPKVESACP
jgi:hypothetical protein